MNRVAVVTGASRGIGRGICVDLLHRGWQVVGAARTDPGPIAGGDTDLAGRMQFIKADVTDEAQVDALRDFVARSLGRLDLLVNAAGVMRSAASVAATATNDWNVTIATNVSGPFMLARAFHELLVRTPGSAVVNVTGGLGRFASGMAGGGEPAYRTSKAALNALTLTLAEELRGEGVAAFAFDPGWVRTDMGGPDAPRSVQDVAAEFGAIVSGPLPSGVLVSNGEAAAW